MKNNDKYIGPKPKAVQFKESSLAWFEKKQDSFDKDTFKGNNVESSNSHETLNNYFMHQQKRIELNKTGMLPSAELCHWVFALLTACLHDLYQLACTKKQAGDEGCWAHHACSMHIVILWPDKVSLKTGLISPSLNKSIRTMLPSVTFKYLIFIPHHSASSFTF